MAAEPARWCLSRNFEVNCVKIEMCISLTLPCMLDIIGY